MSDPNSLQYDDSWWVRNPNATEPAAVAWDLGTYFLSGGWIAEAATAATDPLSAGVQGGAGLLGQAAGGLAGGLAEGAAPGVQRAVSAAPLAALAVAGLAFIAWKVR